MVLKVSFKIVKDSWFLGPYHFLQTTSLKRRRITFVNFDFGSFASGPPGLNAFSVFCEKRKSDPDFDPGLRAFYYARVIEIPTPRWTAYDRVKFKLDLPADIPLKTRERAYTSPIWYNPE